MTVVAPGDMMQRRANGFLGARTKLEYCASFEGELDGEDFEEIADDVRRALGEMVVVSSVGRTLTISTAMSAARQNSSARNIQLTLSSRRGVSQVRACEDLETSAVGWFLGLGFGGGSGLTAISAGITAALTHSAPLTVGVGAVVLASAYSAARALFGRTARNRDIAVQGLVRRVVDKAQSVLAERPNRDAVLPAHSGSRLIR